MVRSAAAILAVLILPSFAQAQEPQRTHTVVRGNTLWGLAQQYYQNPFEWRVIWEANRSVVEDPNWIYPTEVLVIPGLPADRAAAPAADPTAGAPAAPDRTGQRPTPAAQEVPPELVPFGLRSPRPSDEMRSIFYEDRSAGGTGVSRPQDAAYAPVSRDAVYSAPWLIGLGDAPEHTGAIEGFADREARTSTVRSFDNVRVAMDAPARVGSELQIFRVTRTIDFVGQVVSPTGVLTVTTVGNGYVVGTVTKEYGRIQPGDMVGPLPSYTASAGVYAEEITGGAEAMVMGFAGFQVINDRGHIAFLDLGSADGVAVGDEFVLYGQERPAAEHGSLQVVGVSERTSAARIVSLVDDVFEQGIVVRLAKKMR